MSNASDFISSYNVIDNRLRSIYKGKGGLQFSDLVRRCAQVDKTVKKYEEELLSFARLRNAIVHMSTSEQVIAEPSDSATKLISQIAELLSQPPKLSVLKEKGATGISGNSTVREAIITAAKTGYSNLPVYERDRMVGVINNRRIVRALGAALQNGEDISSLLDLPCTKILREEDLFTYYKILTVDDHVQDAIDAFENNRKLLAVIVKDGKNGKIVNIITPSDLPTLYAIFDQS